MGLAEQLTAAATWAAATAAALRLALSPFPWTLGHSRQPGARSEGAFLP